MKLIKKAFTLIELLVVIAIVGILSGLIVISMNSSIDSDNDTKRKANLDTIRKALVVYGTLNGNVYPISTTECTIGGGTTPCSFPSSFLELLPTLPTNPDGTYYKYISSDGTYFTLSANFSSGSTLFYNNKSGYTTFACGSTVSYAGVTYNTVLIGNQCWFKENLNVGTLTAGANTQGTSCTSIQKYCYSNTEANCTTDGGLYQWNQAMCGSTVPRSQGICPSGWHIPTHDEWTTLERSINGSTAFPYNTTTTGWLGTDEGSKLSSFTLNGTNSTGFSAVLAGYRTTAGSFTNRSVDTYLWSSLESSGSAWERLLNSGHVTVYRATYSKAYGFSVRCLKD